ncbi:glycosyltransferase family 4 protein [Variovorax ginsengisoli]|uniref:Glycosyltransferase involved in cell wall biosynthesis n=1 Tax=Variovorax ginsengisoli TaxID=363844 RepID=A0ABT9SE81_9BURK|nr:glycosyltransferase family 1 protein [Variovorax ginsengisoli]MDP9902194.1 glycosyltransferase involved in cell wall biosynthesis [Variovorax ginsengisoli]
MKLAFDGRVFRHENIGGVERYAQSLYDQLKKISDVELLVPKSHDRYSQHLWVQTGLPMATMRAKADALFCPVTAGPVFLPRSVRLVVTIHDLAYFRFPDMYSSAFRNYYKVLLPAVVKRADAIIALTEVERKNIVSYFPGIEKKISVVYSGVGHEFRVSNSVAPKEKIILAVSSLNKHKNITALVNAFSSVHDKIPHKLVLVGGARSIISTDNSIAEALKNIPADRVVLTGYVSDKELIDWYRRAEIFVFPSLFEGFGLPPLEAMSAGCAVIASDRSCIPEVCGEGAIYFDAGSPVALAESMMNLSRDDALRDDLRTRGILHAAKFNWERTGELTLKAIEAAL